MKRDIAYGTAALLIAVAAAVTANAITGTPEHAEDVQATEEPIRQVVAVYDVREQYDDIQVEEPNSSDGSWVPLNFDVPLDYILQYDLWSACEEFGIDYPMMLALIDRETNFQNIDGDGGNSIGYCQIQPRWWSWLMDDIGASDLTNPKDNFRTSCAIMSYLIEKFGTVQDALSAYNTGKPGETEYAREILAERDVWNEVLEIS